MNYTGLFGECRILPNRFGETQARVARIVCNKDQYYFVELATRIPWWVVGILHSLESSCNLACHLHNGDPLSARTVHVPRGRPVANPTSGHFPYSWRESTQDALNGRWEPCQWTLAGTLEFFERYNGMGYREKGILSPYLWSFTDKYTTGLFVFDGKFSPTIVSQNIGAAALLKTLIAQSVVVLAT